VQTCPLLVPEIYVAEHRTLKYAVAFRDFAQGTCFSCVNILEQHKNILTRCNPLKKNKENPSQNETCQDFFFCFLQVNALEFMRVLRVKNISYGSISLRTHH
jgi:hypothetical protein